MLRARWEVAAEARLISERTDGIGPLSLTRRWR